MNSVKGKGIMGRRTGGQMVGDEMLDEETRQGGPEARDAVEDWADETPESEQLRRVLIEAGRAAMPRHDPARLDRVFRRIVAQLEREDEGRDGVPVPRLDSPSGVTAKTFG